MVNRQHGLGRGLGALLSSPGPSSAEAPGTTTIELPIDSISPNPQQPRKDFDDRALHDLAASLKQSGVLQPVVVRRVGEGYQLVVGERRWRAAKLAGITRIPAVIREASDAQSLELALVENLLREDLNPMEEAEAYQRLLAEFAWTQEELAQRVARDRSSIANCLRLLKLPDVIQADLRGGRLTMGHARALLSLDSPAEQLRLREEILTHSWSVRTTEQGVQAKRTQPTRRLLRRSAELAAVEDALRVALATRVRIVGTEREFERAVIEPFARAYAEGRTPVPCVACNREVKFGSLAQRARAWDAVAVGTGHYARITREAAGGRFLLWRGRDTRKDQSDFLWPPTQSQLAAARFPVGDLTKDAVREKARALGLETADKPESQEICFIPDDDYRGFLRRRMPDAFAPGPIVDGQGSVLGRHDGLINYTVGQRRGLGLSSRRPLYVTALDPGRNALVVGEAAAVEVDQLRAEPVNLIAVPALTGPMAVTAKIRQDRKSTRL